MKKILFFSLIVTVFFVPSEAQIKISDLPTFSGNPSGAIVPIVVNGANRKIDASFFGYNKVDSAAFINDTLKFFKNGSVAFVKRLPYTDSISLVRSKILADSTYLKGLISSNTTAISSNTNAIASNTSAIGTKVNIADTGSMLTNYRSAINSNTSNIAANTSNIATNTTSIGSLSGSLGSLSSLSTANKATIVAAINENVGNIASAATSNVIGVASTTTNPGTPVSNVAYNVSGAGTYTNFNSAASTPIVVSATDGLVILRYNTTTGFWTKITSLQDLSNYYNKSSFGSRVIIGKNRFNRGAVTVGFFVSTTGTLTANANSQVSPLIPVTPGESLAIQGIANPSNHYYRFLQSDGTTLAVAGSATNLPSTLTVPALSAYFQFTTKFSTQEADTSYYPNIQVETGTTPTSVVAYSATTYVNGVGGNVIEAGSISTSTQVTKTPTLSTDIIPKSYFDANVPVPSSYTVSSKNLFNRSAVIAGFYVSTGGALAANANSQVSALIPVTPTQTIAIQGVANVSNHYYRFLKADGVTLAVAGNATNLPSTLTVPALASYFQFTTKFSTQETDTSIYYPNIQVEVNSAPTAVVSYFTPYSIVNKLNSNDIEAGTLKSGATMAGKTVATTDQIASQTTTISIATSDKIAVFGNSYTNGYAMWKKHYLDVLGMYSDFEFVNYGKSGDDLLEVLARVRADQVWLGTIPPSQMGITYGIIACRDNNQATYAINIDTYYENAKKLAKAIEALGGKPILSTEHQIMSGSDAGLFNSFVRLSKEEGYMFMNWGRFAQKSFQTYFSPLWRNAHPGTRTNWLWSMGMKPYLETLPRLEQGIKLFRVRPTVDTSNKANLVYETTFDRAKIYEELVIGQNGLTQASEQYFDQLNNVGAVYQDYNSEYQALQAGTSVSVGNYFLSEFITPYSAEGLGSFTLSFTATGVTHVYVKNTLGLTSYLSSDGTDATYQANFQKPVGEWYELTVSNGSVTVPSTLFKQVMSYDKLSFLFQGSSMSFTDIRATVTGTKRKVKTKRDFVEVATGTEMLTDNLLDNSTSWQNIASIPSVTPITNPLNGAESESFPSGITTVKRITTQQLIQTLPSVTNVYRDKIVQIRVLCRYFPTYIDTTIKWASSAIVRGSYDAADLNISIQNSTNPIVKVATHPVGLYWMEVVYDAMLPDGINKIIIESPSHKAIDVAKVNVISK